MLVATPGRLLDHLQNTKAFHTGGCQWHPVCPEAVLNIASKGRATAEVQPCCSAGRAGCILCWLHLMCFAANGLRCCCRWACLAAWLATRLVTRLHLHLMRCTSARVPRRGAALAGAG